MKTFACSLITAVSLVATGTAFAAASEDLQLTGTIVEVRRPIMVLETPKKERFEFSIECDLKPKVGETGTLHYYITGRGKWIACTFEKTGKTEKSRKKK